jgi:hypothetical protein
MRHSSLNFGPSLCPPKLGPFLLDVAHPARGDMANFATDPIAPKNTIML